MVINFGIAIMAAAVFFLTQVYAEELSLEIFIPPQQ